AQTAGQLLLRGRAGQYLGHRRHDGRGVGDGRAAEYHVRFAAQHARDGVGERGADHDVGVAVIVDVAGRGHGPSAAVERVDAVETDAAVAEVGKIEIRAPARRLSVDDEAFAGIDGAARIGAECPDDDVVD